MENNNTITNPSKGIEDTIVVDFQRIFSRMLSFWWLFVLCFVAAIALGKIYLRYTTFQYSSRAVLLIKEAGNSGGISEQSIIADQFLSADGKSMDNEIQILKSLTLMEKVVERLHLRVAYYRIGKLKDTELYTASPFTVDSFTLNKAGAFGKTFFLEQKDYKTFVFKKSEEDPGNRYPYGKPFETEDGIFLINLSHKVAVLPGLYRVVIYPLEASANLHKANLAIERIGSHTTSSVLQLKTIDPVAEKARDILNTLIDVYNEEEIKDENTVLRNTIDFIDFRVASLVGELDSVEGGIKRYKSANSIISDDAASSMSYTLGEIRSSIQEISNFEIQKNMLESLESFLTSDRNDFDLIPANLIAENPVLSGFVNQYNSLVLQNKKMSNTASAKNPVRMELESQMVDLRELIIETIQNLKMDLQIPIAEIEKNIQSLRNSMSSIPGIEKTLIEKMRTQAVKEKLFLYLLQKREETALTEAVTTAKTRTIDRARLSKSPVYPKRKMVTMFSGALGLAIPFLLVLVIGLFENKVDSEETIKQLTSIPILGRIAFKKGNDHIIVKKGSRSAINEMFRLLRTNLNFVNHGKDQQTILFTSSVSGEGKTFIAINLGITLALANKKVVIIGLDLRKPKLGQYLENPDGKGASNYLVGQNSVDDILKTYKDNPNLSYITSGPIPPNPAELILSKPMEHLLEELKERFDYILIDTPPIGLVSDALLLRPFIDNILILVRHKYTRRFMLKNLEALYQKKELEKTSIIFNGVKQGRGYYGYGGYNYGYNQEYYVDED
ncbi:MAG: GumC family protein [Saprospiraceae bacterium]